MNPTCLAQSFHNQFVWDYNSYNFNCTVHSPANKETRTGNKHSSIASLDLPVEKTGQEKVVPVRRSMSNRNDSSMIQNLINGIFSCCCFVEV